MLLGFTGAGTLVVEPEVAAGPGYVMQVVQGEGMIYSKGGYCWSGAPQSTLCGGFLIYMVKIFNNANSCDGVGDTRILYDPSSNRWFAAGIHTVVDCTTGLTLGNFADVVVSSSDPTDPWKVVPNNDWKDYSAPTGSCYDHPEIAINDGNLILTTNICSTMLVYNKADIVNHLSSPRDQDFTSSIPTQCAYQPHPVRNFGSTTRQYMICMGSLTNGAYPFYLFYIDGTVPTATCCGAVTKITSIQQPKSKLAPYETQIFSYADAPPTRGVNYTTFAWSFLDISAAWSHNVVWFATTAACPDVSTQDCIRLTQYNSSPNPPSACNVGSIPGLCQDFYFEQQGEDLFLPALTIDSIQDLGLVFDYSSSTINPSLGITGQAVGDPSGTWTPPKILKAGVTYQTNRRFSDYFGAATDSTDPTLIWMTGGYILSGPCVQGQNYPTCWASWVGSLRVVGLAISSNTAFWIDSGWSASASVSIQARGGFSSTLNGAVSLSASVSPTTAGTGSVGPTSVQVGLGGTSSALASVSDASTVPWPGSYTLTITAQTQDLSITLAITILVSQFDFAMSASPSSLQIQPEYCCSTSGTSTLTLTLAIGVLGPTATFSSQGQPSYMQITYSPSPATVGYPPGTPVTVTFNIPAGGIIYTTHTYSVIITGTADGVSHSVTVSITVYFDCTRGGGCFNAPSP